GKMSIRRAGRMHHLGIGAEHAGKRVIALADDTTITVIHLDTGEVIATNEIRPDKTYWRNTQKAPGRWPRAL
ncbi:IS481 family transposase, partial [Agromyces sp. NPDC052230]